MKLKYLVIFIIILTSCEFNSKKMTNNSNNVDSTKAKNLTSTVNNYKNIDTDTMPIRIQDERISKIEMRKKNILEKGDGSSFVVLDLTLNYENDYMTILPYALLMSEKYNHKDAYMIFFINSIKILNNGVYKDEYFFDLDVETQRFLKHYLRKGADLDQSKCKSILINLEKIAKERGLEF